MAEYNHSLSVDSPESTDSRVHCCCFLFWLFFCSVPFRKCVLRHTILKRGPLWQHKLIFLIRKLKQATLLKDWETNVKLNMQFSGGDLSSFFLCGGKGRGVINHATLHYSLRWEIKA